MDVSDSANKDRGFWSLHSSDESIELGELRFWAMAETALAIGVFWYVALRWETFLLLYSSLFIAPLLLFRSPQSVKRGAQLFDKGFFPIEWPKDPEARKAAVSRLQKRWGWIGVGIGIVAVVAIGYPAAKMFL